MSENSPSASLPKRQIPDEQVENYRDAYVGLVGFVPPRIQARTDLLARLDPELLSMQEELRHHYMYPDCFDTKTSQLMLFAILLTNLQAAAKLVLRFCRALPGLLRNPVRFIARGYLR